MYQCLLAYLDRGNIYTRIPNGYNTSNVTTKLGNRKISFRQTIKYVIVVAGSILGIAPSAMENYTLDPLSVYDVRHHLNKYE
jgi:hypothetical protein